MYHKEIPKENMLFPYLVILVVIIMNILFDVRDFFELILDISFNYRNSEILNIIFFIN